MSRALVIAFTLVFIGCSGATKKESSQTTGAQATTQQAADAKSAAAKGDLKANAKEAKKAATTKVEASESGATVCTYNDVKREIAVVESDERCVVEYTKDGEKREIGSGLPKSPVCQGIAEKVKSNLESNGYKCE